MPLKDLPKRAINFLRQAGGKGAARANVRALKGKPKTSQPRASLAEALEGGARLDVAITGYVRKLLKEKRLNAARSFVHALVDDSHAAPNSHLAAGVFFYLQGFVSTAASHFNRVDGNLALGAAPVEYIGAMFAADRRRGLNAWHIFRKDSYGQAHPDVQIELLNLLAKFYCFPELNAELALAGEQQLADGGASKPLLQQFRWMKSIMANRAETVPARPREITIGVMDYKALDRSTASTNLGDHVQTLAALANICRFSDVDFDDGSELGSYVTKLQRLVRPDRRIRSGQVRVSVAPVDRDFASGRQYSGPVWLISNGWFMHRSFAGAPDFPFPKQILPIFLSVHINDPDILTPTVAKYLKAHQPIGCRDWTTVYLLRDVGVSAFFSGCLTSTVGQLFPAHSDDKSNAVAIIDAEVGDGEYAGMTRKKFIQIDKGVPDLSQVEGIETARKLLETYMDHKVIATSRLHCYLPCRSLGLNVDFRPRTPADVRFDGLLRLDNRSFAEMRRGLEEKLEAVLAKILTGAPEKTVRKLWRELCADDVALAEKHCKAPFQLPAPSFEIAEVAARVRNNVVERGPTLKRGAMEIAFAVDQNLSAILPVVLESIQRFNKQPARVHILTRGIDTSYVQRLHDLFPRLQLKQYDFSDIDYGTKLQMLSHTTVSTMDRLLLPDILPDVAKILYLDVDTLVQADIRELYDTDLGDNVLAGRRTEYRQWRTAVRLMTIATSRLNPEKAWELRRYLHGLGSLACDAFNAGVILMNLRKMREEGFSRFAVPLIENYGFNDQDALNLFARGRFVRLEKHWNHVPNQDFSENPRIIHWAGRAKPWLDRYVSKKPVFKEYERRTQQAASPQA